MRPVLRPMQLSVTHSVLSVHCSPGCFVAPASGTAQTQTSCVGPGAETLFKRHVDVPPHSAALQHVSKHRDEPPPTGFSQRPERQSVCEVHTRPPIFPPVTGGLRDASACGTQ